MFGLSFVDAPRVERAHPARADVALFVGWTRRRADSAVPATIASWLRERRYLPDAAFADGTWRTDPLRDIPVPIDTWSVFDALFDWHARPVSAGGPDTADDYLGLAVRDFFANGGRKCYVVRLGDSWPVLTTFTESSRAAHVAALLPEQGASSWQREAWRGIEHVFALDEVSLLLVPDLAPLYAGPPGNVPGDARVEPGPPEVFVECGSDRTAQPAVAGVRRIRAPRLDDDGLRAWNDAVNRLRQRVSQQRRDVMLLLAVPLLDKNARAARDPLRALTVRSSMLQLATPWFVPSRAQRTSEGLLPPDGALAGLVAASVLSRGAAGTAAGQAPLGVLGLEPAPGDELLRRHAETDDSTDTWLTRCAMFGPTAAGVRLLSDRTASQVAGWRHGGVVRLLCQLLRTARMEGQTMVFEPSGEALWTRVRSRFEDMLARYWQAGALRGATEAEAFSVQCDRSVMSQADIDSGRVVVLVEFAPQLSIERLRVALALAEDGGVQWTDADALAEVSP